MTDSLEPGDVTFSYRIASDGQLDAVVSKAIDRDVAPPSSGDPELPGGSPDAVFSGAEVPCVSRPLPITEFTPGKRVYLVKDVRLRLNKREGLVLTVVKAPYFVMEPPVDDSLSWSVSESLSTTVATLHDRTVVRESVYNPDTHKFRNRKVKLRYLGDESASASASVFTAVPVCQG